MPTQHQQRWIVEGRKRTRAPLSARRRRMTIGSGEIRRGKQLTCRERKNRDPRRRKSDAFGGKKDERRNKLALTVAGTGKRKVSRS